MLENLRAFLIVAQHDSLRAASNATGVARTTLRRRLEALEAEAGVALFSSDEGGTALTEPGQLLLEEGQRIVLETDALLKSLREMGREPAGMLRVIGPSGVPAPVLIETIAGLAQRHPLLRFDLHFSDDPVADLMRSGAHIAFQPGPRVAEGPWMAFVVRRIAVRLLASRDYVAQRGAPQTIAELDDHPLLCAAFFHGGERLPLLAGGSIPVTPLICSRDVPLLRHMAARGLGVAWTFSGDLPGPDPLQGELVPVLEDVVGAELPIWAVVPRALAKVPKVRLLVEAIRAL